MQDTHLQMSLDLFQLQMTNKKGSNVNCNSSLHSESSVGLLQLGLVLVMAEVAKDDLVMSSTMHYVSITTSKDI